MSIQIPFEKYTSQTYSLSCFECLITTKHRLWTVGETSEHEYHCFAVVHLWEKSVALDCADFLRDSHTSFSCLNKVENCKHNNSDEQVKWSKPYTVPEGPRRLRHSRQSAYESGEVVCPTHWPHLPPGTIPGAHFCWRMSSSPGPHWGWKDFVNEKSQ